MHCSIYPTNPIVHLGSKQVRVVTFLHMVGPWRMDVATRAGTKGLAGAALGSVVSCEVGGCRKEIGGGGICVGRENLRGSKGEELFEKGKYTITCKEHL